MKTWMAALGLTLGLCGIDARAQEPIKNPPTPVGPAMVAPALVAVPAEVPPAAPCGVACGEKCCTSWHQAPAGRVCAWLTFRPVPSGTNLVCVGPRPPKPYQFFLNGPCNEGCGGQACVAGACAKESGCGWCGLRFWR